MASEISYVMSDESINRYGFRVLTTGIDLTAFAKNPVALAIHDGKALPVGLWKDVQKNDRGQLVGTLSYDEDDELAMTMYKKAKKGMMNAVSIGFNAMELSDDPQYLLQGQKYPTVTKSDLMECSPVPLPANRNAVKLFGLNGAELKLGFDVKEVNLPPVQTQNLDMDVVKLNALIPGLTLAAGSNEEVAAAAVNGLLSAKDNEIKKLKGDAAKACVGAHIKRGVILTAQEAFWLRAYENDPEGTAKQLEGMTVKPDFGKFPNQTQKGEGKDKLAAGREDWTFLDWYKKDQKGLQLMQKNEPEAYKALHASHVESLKAEGSYNLEGEDE
jgi:HK97 family phage prohead protease